MDWKLAYENNKQGMTLRICLKKASCKVRKCVDYKVDSQRSRERPDKTWKDLVCKDMQARGLNGELGDVMQWCNVMDTESRCHG